MRILFLFCLTSCLSLFATKIDPNFPARLTSPPVQYLEHRIEGDRFKITFVGGVVFDACACGCEKDAADALSQWHQNDGIEVYPYAEDKKGFIYLLKNLENDTEVYSWIKTKLPDSVFLPRFLGPGSLPNTFKTSDGNTWLYLADVDISSWQSGERILTCNNAFLDAAEFLLLNFDNAEKRHIKAYLFLN